MPLSQPHRQLGGTSSMSMKLLHLPGTVTLWWNFLATSSARWGQEAIATAGKGFPRRLWGNVPLSFHFSPKRSFPFGNPMPLSGFQCLVGASGYLTPTHPSGRGAWPRRANPGATPVLGVHLVCLLSLNLICPLLQVSLLRFTSKRNNCCHFNWYDTVEMYRMGGWKTVYIQKN